MNRILLTHLTFTGPDAAIASVEFGQGLNVIYGASDTGKSFIVEALNYMLGATRLRDIPEISPYSHVLLGLRFDDGSDVTLVRPVVGGKFSVYNGYFGSPPLGPAAETLATKHGISGQDNISSYLLARINMDKLKLRKNQKNETRNLSIRDVVHVSLVDETRMQAPRSPVLASGQYTSATAEKSAFRLFISGEDDSRLSANPSTEQKRASKAKVEILDSVIADLAKDVASLSDIDELRDMLTRLSNTVGDFSNSIAELSSKRADGVNERAELSGRLVALKERSGEVHDLLGRFNLLKEQYESDLARLEMVEEAGSLLGFFDVGVCLFCGASPEDQHRPEHDAHDTTMLGEAVRTERSKTESLRADLLETINDLVDQQASLDTSNAMIVRRMDQLADEISSLDERMRPLAVALTDLLASRSSVEKSIAIFEQIEKLEARRGSLSSTNGGERFDSPKIEVRTLHEFTDVLKETLDRWNVPESTNVGFDLVESDLLVGNQPRSNRGKGMRAILHGAFTVSLAKYCLERDMPHPGFVILDSPVVTYRGPSSDIDANPEIDEFMSASVAGSLYRNLDAEFDGQAIVVENITPPKGLTESTVSIHFTGSHESGRYGLFPAFQSK